MITYRTFGDFMAVAATGDEARSIIIAAADALPS
jgi:hypothetical protein